MELKAGTGNEFRGFIGQPTEDDELNVVWIVDSNSRPFYRVGEGRRWLTSPMNLMTSATPLMMDSLCISTHLAQPYPTNSTDSPAGGAVPPVSQWDRSGKLGDRTRRHKLFY